MLRGNMPCQNEMGVILKEKFSRYRIDELSTNKCKKGGAGSGWSENCG